MEILRSLLFIYLFIRAFPLNVHVRKLGETTMFYAVFMQMSENLEVVFLNEALSVSWLNERISRQIDQALLIERRREKGNRVVIQHCISFSTAYIFFITIISSFVIS